ncbi:hypothetical protein [Paractinoplanes toevensis]|uniref:Adhesin domain-containing protein n=1 Tax=Paractinoplanes toevensis TaxID=571911 RepID=A0A919THP9_9ACTN|nr:hypothetical protein [Actinoplanes toevensis]GIM94585.1 hypothetical protein Ato02nite_063780 [Actinoplanes toevensis]
MHLRPLISLALIVSLTGCTDVAAVNDTRDDQQEFALSAQRLVIDNNGGSLRLIAGSGPAVAVRRSLTGKATVEGNASWSLTGDTLRLGINCSGFVPDCGGLHIVSVPPGVAVELTSDGPVRAVQLAGALTATVSDAWLKVEDPTGPLHLEADLDIDVSGARSTDVAASSREHAVHLTFTAPPTRVEARAAGSVKVLLPAGPETYRVSSAPGRSALKTDPASKRLVEATAGEGHTASVRKAA